MHITSFFIRSLGYATVIMSMGLCLWKELNIIYGLFYIENIKSKIVFECKVLVTASIVIYWIYKYIEYI